MRTPEFQDAVAMVTGGRSGIGAAVAEELLERVARVGVLDVGDADPDAESEARADMLCDVRNPDEVAAAHAALRDRFGAIDHVVQCAGITRDHVLWKLSDNDWRQVLDVNLTGAFNGIREVVPAMREAGRGAIVNVASINALRGKLGQANYSASKAGLVALTRTAARELGPFGIRVNAVAPGMVRTPMTESLPEEALARAVDESALKRISEPRDVAAVILFLLSDLARQVTGEVVRVDAGQLC